MTSNLIPFPLPRRRVHRGDESGTPYNACVELRDFPDLPDLLEHVSTVYRDGQGKWRDARRRFITEEQAGRIIAEATAQSQLQTPNPSVSPLPLAHSHSSSAFSFSTFGSSNSSPRSSSFVKVSPTGVVPEGYEPDDDSEEPSQPPSSPHTPRRPRHRYSFTPVAPPRVNWPAAESEADEEDNHNASPSTVRRQGVSPLPSIAALGLRTGSSFGPHHPTISSGLKTPPSLGSAAASVLVGPMSISDALMQIHSLCGGQFYDDGRPKSEVEYRCNFIFATLGLSDEQIASLWANHLVYDGPAHDWYETLTSNDAGKAAAKEWSTLQPEIEKRWPTPARDPKAAARRHRTRWKEHKFDIQTMLDALTNESSSTRPHQAWAQHHKALGAALTMSDEEKVLQMVEILSVYLIELLPKRDSYDGEWDELIADIGNISSRLLLNRYNQQRMVDVEMSPQKPSARKIQNSCSASVKIPACQSRRRSRNHIWVPVSAQESVYSGTLQESGSSCNWQLQR
ncbi:Retrovirus-related Pol polyprotein from transposon [Ceratobasidium sp. AG-Ba]|nr:Retrovirus-related Pol polyprotein from transposon [Ceratobasidium sp. AG-Ba]